MGENRGRVRMRGVVGEDVGCGGRSVGEDVGWVRM